MARARPSARLGIASAKQVVFDGLTDDDQITVTLTGPDGQVMTRNLRNGDNYEWGGGNPVLSLVPGDYADVLREWRSRRHCWRACCGYRWGEADHTLARNVCRNRATAFTFNGSAGDHIFLDRQGAYYGGDLTSD